MTATTEPQQATLRAFHGDPAIKEQYLARVRAHAAADEIIHGRYWLNGHGCAIGCTIHSGEHRAYETELGLPTWLARLEDGLFEALANGEAQTFPGRFLDAIPVGADVSGVRDQFLAWLMDDPTYGLAHMAREDEIRALAAEVGRRLRTGENVGGPEAEALTEKLGVAWDAWAARDPRPAWAARAAWDASDARDAWAVGAVGAARDAWAARAAWAVGVARAAWAARAARDARPAWAARAAWDASDARDAWAVGAVGAARAAWAARAAGPGGDARPAWAARAAWAAWDARDARDARAERAAKDAWAAWAAWAAWDARGAFVVASAAELLRGLADAPVPAADRA